MGISVDLNSTFKKALNPKFYEFEAKKGLYTVARVAGDNSNNIAPLDKGNLRLSFQVVKIGQDIEQRWTVPYAYLRYYNNKKNPQTTMWAEKDWKKNGQKYADYLAKQLSEQL